MRTTPIRQEWDYYHEEFYGEGPDLSDDGWAYYALYGIEPDLERHTARTHTCLSEAETVARAEGAFETVTWEENH